MRIALITDIHEDLPSLEKMIARAEKKGFDLMVCLGDICGFGLPHYRYREDRTASGCLALVREKCEIIIPGNHDLHAAQRIPEHSDVFSFPRNWFELDAASRELQAGETLWTHNDDLCPGYSYEDLGFLRGLPEYAILESPAGKILFSHYAYPNLSGFARGFYHHEGAFHRHFTFMREKDSRISFIGHAHPRGFYMVHPEAFSHPRSRRRQEIPVKECIIGLPPVTRHRRRRAFCIFDTSSLMLQIIR